MIKIFLVVLIVVLGGIFWLFESENQSIQTTPSVKSAIEPQALRTPLRSVDPDLEEEEDSTLVSSSDQKVLLSDNRSRETEMNEVSDSFPAPEVASGSGRDARDLQDDIIAALSDELGGSAVNAPPEVQVDYIEPGPEPAPGYDTGFDNRRAGDFYPGSGRTSQNRRNETADPLSENQELVDPLLEDVPIPDLLPRLAGQARGYTMLYLMQPEARNTVELQIQAMLDAEIQDLYLGVLTDGTFGKDFNYFRSTLDRLSTGGRKITLVIYLTNGPTMRRFDSTPIDAGFSKIDPIVFRELIQEDSATRNRFLELVEEVKPIFEYNKSLNSQNTNIAVVMLEDNLDSTSYLAMRQLASSVLGDSVIYMRNPCPRCYEGNDIYSYGDRLELHRPEGLHALSAGDGFTLDGESYHFPEESGSGLTLEEVEFFKAMSMDQGLRYFGLWRTQRQGLQEGQSVHPRDRIYEVPSAAQLEKEIQLLRSGLISIE